MVRINHNSYIQEGYRSDCRDRWWISIIPIASSHIHDHPTQSKFPPWTRLHGSSIHPPSTVIIASYICRPTVVVFLNIGGAFHSVNRNRLFQCLAKFGMREKFVITRKVLFNAKLRSSEGVWAIITFVHMLLRCTSRMSNFVSLIQINHG